MKNGHKIISVIGLGYVGLPVAMAFNEAGFEVYGYDVNKKRINELTNNHDKTGEVKKERLHNCSIKFSLHPDILKRANFHIVTVPTPIDEFNKPDLMPLIKASKMLAKIIKKQDIIVFESTVFPGATEEVIVPEIEKSSKLSLNSDFSVGYSPERINPADKKYKFENIKKVVSASNKSALKIIQETYAKVVKAEIYLAPSIKVAEAAKVIENTQRDLNIAFMNELVKIFQALDINTNDVLDAASTKWNFLPFRPGLVGGHCIGVDPYYLIHKAQQVGVIPDLLISARRINDTMSSHFAKNILNVLNNKNFSISSSKILILGVAFKENCPDIRNSKVIDLINELKSFRINVDIFDPVVDIEDTKSQLKIDLVKKPKNDFYDIVVIAVPHNQFKKMGSVNIRKFCNDRGSIMDLKNTLPKSQVDHTV